MFSPVFLNKSVKFIVLNIIIYPILTLILFYLKIYIDISYNNNKCDEYSFTPTNIIICSILPLFKSIIHILHNFLFIIQIYTISFFYSLKFIIHLFFYIIDTLIPTNNIKTKFNSITN